MGKSHRQFGNVYEDFTNAVIETGAIKDIPYFGQFVKYAEQVQNISNHIFIKKLSRFVEDINSLTHGDLKQINKKLNITTASS